MGPDAAGAGVLTKPPLVTDRTFQMHSTGVLTASFCNYYLPGDGANCLLRRTARECAAEGR